MKREGRRCPSGTKIHDVAEVKKLQRPPSSTKGSEALRFILFARGLDLLLLQHDGLLARARLGLVRLFLPTWQRHRPMIVSTIV
jgi:hypothetical protein